MKTLPKGSMVFTEDTNIRKRRTAVVIPTDSLTYFIGWAECGPSDEFNRETGVREARKRANKAKWLGQLGSKKEIPNSGTFTLSDKLAKERDSDVKAFRKFMQDLLYTGGVFRTKNTVDTSDMFRISRSCREVYKSLVTLAKEVSIAVDGVKPEDTPKELGDLALAALTLTKELKKWKKLNPNKTMEEVTVEGSSLSQPAQVSSSQTKSSG